MLRAKVAKLEARLRELEVEQCETSSAGGASLSPEPSRGSSSSPGISLYMPPNGAPCFENPPKGGQSLPPRAHGTHEEGRNIARTVHGLPNHRLAPEVLKLSMGLCNNFD